jgi:hypothetical protein
MLGDVVVTNRICRHHWPLRARRIAPPVAARINLVGTSVVYAETRVPFDGAVIDVNIGLSEDEGQHWSWAAGTVAASAVDAVLCSSGHGDGEYDVLSGWGQGKLQRIRIVFLDAPPPRISG